MQLIDTSYHKKQLKHVASSPIVKKNKHTLSSSFNFIIFFPFMIAVISMTKAVQKMHYKQYYRQAKSINLQFNLLLLLIIIINDGMHSMVSVVVPSCGLLLTQINIAWCAYQPPSLPPSLEKGVAVGDISPMYP